MTMELIPAMDLRGGRVVRLFQGDFGVETRYELAPGKLYARYAAAGARRIHELVLELRDRKARWRLPSPAWSLSRSVLDALLLSRASDAGASILQPASVHDVRYSADRGQTWTALGVDLTGGAVDLPAALRDAMLLWAVTVAR